MLTKKYKIKNPAKIKIIIKQQIIKNLVIYITIIN